MPVMFIPEQEMKWIDPLIDFQEANQYLLPYPENDMTVYPISILVNSPKNDTAEIVKPAASR
jgi:putative SOS response-associated peptidase YedK